MSKKLEESVYHFQDIVNSIPNIEEIGKIASDERKAQSLSESADHLVQIIKLIKDAALQGKRGVSIGNKISKDTEKALQDKGYTVTYINNYSDGYFKIQF